MSQFSIVKNGDVYVAKGKLDEFADLSPLPSGQAELTLDFSGITRVNSIGTRNWLHFVNGYQGKVTFIACSASFMDAAANIASMFGPDGYKAVKKAELPFLCSRCDRDQYRFVELVPILDTGASPSFECDFCDGIAELDRDEFTLMWPKKRSS